MTLNQAISCVAFVVITTAILCGYIESRQYHFRMNGQEYEQIGVMATEIDGQEMYLPIFRRVSK
jgi:hypothetical protein